MIKLLSNHFQQINKRNLKPTSREEIELAQVLQDFHPLNRPLSECTIFLAYTSNMVSSGVREVIRFLAEHNMVRFSKFYQSLILSFKFYL